MPWPNQNQAGNMISFNLKQILENVAGFKGKDFPAALAGIQKGNLSELADNGTALRKKDLMGGYYFMPDVAALRIRADSKWILSLCRDKWLQSRAKLD